ncbi:phasin family protein [Methylocystis silviterrae]|uniref:phasin family protein n=1 Tax=Methylocystis silviterrae TaxID=2743612 RepID=UPI0038CC04A1
MNSVSKFAGDLSAAKSPTDFANVLVDYTRQQFESLTERFDELSVLVNKTTSKEDDAVVLGLGD